MLLRDAITLIKPAALDSKSPAVWADLGCGTGLFTRALSNLLHPESTIYAIDKKPQELPKNIHFIQKDFEKDDLDLPPLDGVLMANSLHFVQDKKALIQKLKTHAFLIVEYDTMNANPYVPYPIDRINLETLFRGSGYKDVTFLGDHASIYGRARMYAATIKRGL